MFVLHVTSTRRSKETSLQHHLLHFPVSRSGLSSAMDECHTGYFREKPDGEIFQSTSVQLRVRESIPITLTTNVTDYCSRYVLRSSDALSSLFFVQPNTPPRYRGMTPWVTSSVMCQPPECGHVGIRGVRGAVGDAVESRHAHI